MVETSAATLPLDAETIDMWQHDHEYLVAESQSGSYQEHLSRQMLMVLDALRAARHAQQQAERFKTALERIKMLGYENASDAEKWPCGDEEIKSSMWTTAIAALTAERDASSAGEP